MTEERIKHLRRFFLTSETKECLDEIERLRKGLKEMPNEIGNLKDNYDTHYEHGFYLAVTRMEQIIRRLLDKP